MYLKMIAVRVSKDIPCSLSSHLLQRDIVEAPEAYETLEALLQPCWSQVTTLTLRFLQEPDIQPLGYSPTWRPRGLSKVEL